MQVKILNVVKSKKKYLYFERSVTKQAVLSLEGRKPSSHTHWLFIRWLFGGHICATDNEEPNITVKGIFSMIFVSKSDPAELTTISLYDFRSKAFTKLSNIQMLEPISQYLILCIQAF